MNEKEAREITAIYFGDAAGYINKERDGIIKELLEYGINIPIRAQNLRPRYDDVYNILFFDYGGMSGGNTMLEHFCQHWYKSAAMFPSRIYVMVSECTAAAMDDIIARNCAPQNVFTSVKRSIKAINELIKERRGIW